MDALPYYKWHWQDWRANRRVQRMPWQAKGPYRELLDEFWAEGSLPTEMGELADIVGCTEAELSELWVHIGPCWEERDGRLYNSKMDRQRTSIDRARVAMSTGGANGGKACNSFTRAKGTEATPKPTLVVPQAMPDIGEERRLEETREEESKPLASTAVAVTAGGNGEKHPDRLIYEAYPRREGRAKALKAIAKAVVRVSRGEGESPPCDATTARKELWKTVARYARSPAGMNPDPTKIPHPATWFNESRYLDDQSNWNHVNGASNGAVRKLDRDEQNAANARTALDSLERDFGRPAVLGLSAASECDARHLHDLREGPVLFAGGGFDNGHPGVVIEGEARWRDGLPGFGDDSC